MDVKTNSVKSKLNNVLYGSVLGPLVLMFSLKVF